MGHWTRACLLLALGCASPAPMPPRVAAALGGRPRGCTITCPLGTWCDTDTGQCVGAAVGATTSTAASTAGASTAEEPGAREEGLRFGCATVDGQTDDVVAEDVDAAERVCVEMNGMRCRCRPSDPAASDD